MYRAPSFDNFWNGLDSCIPDVKTLNSCSICSKITIKRRASCAKCEILWCVECYVNIVARTTIDSGNHHIKCPNCRMLRNKQFIVAGIFPNSVAEAKEFGNAQDNNQKIQ
jgi:hypothetical protein